MDGRMNLIKDKVCGKRYFLKTTYNDPVYATHLAGLEYPFADAKA